MKGVYFGDYSVSERRKKNVLAKEGIDSSLGGEDKTLYIH
jgi:hypothetical protein